VSDVKQIKCARCDCALQGPANAQAHDRVVCPECGEGDTLDRVLAEVGEYVKEQAAASLSQSISKGAKGSKFLKVTSNFKPKGGHRFVMDVDF
jgi:phage FluMu protein Com